LIFPRNVAFNIFPGHYQDFYFGTLFALPGVDFWWARLWHFSSWVFPTTPIKIMYKRTSWGQTFWYFII
jgi:hypothetical protein